jgi:hypothetical protein
VYFEVGINVSTGRFEDKFIVDGKWAYRKEKSTVPEPMGSFNNFIEVTGR